MVLRIQHAQTNTCTHTYTYKHAHTHTHMHTNIHTCTRTQSHTPLPLQYEAEDVVGNGNLFDALGVGLGTREMYNINLTMKKLGEDPKRGVNTARFFGKFFGLYADYYVFETTVNDNPAIPEAPGVFVCVCADYYVFETTVNDTPAIPEAPGLCVGLGGGGGG